MIPAIMSNPNSKNWYKQGLAVFIVCIGIGLFMQHGGMLSEFNQTWIDREVRDTGFVGAMYFVFISSFATACGAPRQIVAFFGGYAFGLALGTFIAIFATLLGCVLTFYISRWVARPYILKTFSRQASKINCFLGTHPTRKTIIIRLLPIGSNLITNIAAGLTSVKQTAFFSGSAIGYLPQTVVFALLGKGILIGSQWKIAVSILLLLVSSYMSITLYKKHKRSFNSETNISPAGSNSASSERA